MPELTRYQRDEVYDYLRLMDCNNLTLSPPNFIPFKSNVYDLTADKFYDYSQDFVFTNKIPYDYNINAVRQSTIDDFIRKIADDNEDIINLIYEFVGYCFYRQCVYRKLAVFRGRGGNGKSSLLNLIKKLFGKDNISVLTLNDLTNKYRIGDLHDKFVNIGDDISSSYIPDPDLIKKIATGGEIIAEKKFKDHFQFKNTAKMFFAANELPRVNDKTIAFISRLLIIPLNHDFLNDPDSDPFLKDKDWSKDELEYFIKLAMDGLKRLLKNDGFTKSTDVIKEINEYERYNNPVIEFLDEYGNVEGKLTDDVYEYYQKWCLKNNIKAQQKDSFSKVVCSVTGLKTKNGLRVNGKQKRYYTRG